MKGDIQNIVELVKYPMLDAEEILTNDKIIEYIKDNLSNGRKKYEHDIDYFIGRNDTKDYVKDGNNPNNKITTPWARKLTQTVKGYIYKPGSISYIDANKTKQFEEIKEIYEKNYEDLENAELGEQQSKYGIGIEILYTKDIDGKTMPAFKWVDPADIILVFDTTIDKNIIYVIRYYAIGKETKVINNKDVLIDNYRVEIYTKNMITYYSMLNTESGELKLTGEAENVYKDIPFIVYPNNHEYMADYQPIKQLVKLCDKVYSDTANELDRFAAAYMVFKNYIFAGNKEEAAAKLEQLKQTRIFNVGDDGSVSFLTKDIPVEFFREVRNMIWNDIQSFSCIPNFRDEAFGTASGIAIKFKLIDFEYLATDKESFFKQGLEKRLKLISSYLGIIGTKEDLDVKITFTRNLPDDVKEAVETVTKLKGIVPDELLLGQIPFIEDVEDALEKMKEQQELNMIDLDDVEDDEEDTEGVDADESETSTESE